MGELVGKWNYYFLRYGAGTVVGAIILIALGLHGDDCFWQHEFHHLLQKVREGKIPSLTALAALGFAYCYIASAPGLVFHTARGLFSNAKDLIRLRAFRIWEQKGQKDGDAINDWLSAENELRKQRRVWIAIILAVLFASVAVSIFIFLRFCCAACVCSFTRMMLLRHGFVGVGVVASAFVFIFQAVLIYAVFWRFQNLQDFYFCLTKRRAFKAVTKKEPNTNNVQEYVESYQHMREHGNAFEIIFLELILAAALFAFKNYFPVVIALWVLPAAFCWLIGTFLEFDIPDKNT